MRCRCPAWLIPAFLAVGTVRAGEVAERFPYSAFVLRGEASVRSGPGESFYPVLTLRQGDAVEVWRHDPGGWCAIRPPEGAFSWISADFIEVAGERTGVVRGNQVNVRVGTHFSDMRDAVQVKLDDGETVDLIERRVLTTAGRETTWYKIHPPSGEFRWIHIRQLVRHPDELPQTPDLASSGDVAGAKVTQASFDEDADAATTDALQMRGPIDVLALLDAVPSDAAAGEVLDGLETVLSRMVAAEPTAWSFGELQRRGETVLDTATTAGERGRARMFLSKLARFQDIQSRYAAIAHLREETAEVDRQLGGTPMNYEVVQTVAVEESSAPQVAAQPNLPALPAVANVEQAPPQKSLAEQAGIDIGRYDAAGRLQLLAGAAGQAAGYVLTNERGEVAAYVTPAPGTNLRPYLDHDVGINGIRGYLPEKQMLQITAKRVDVLRR